MKNEILEYRNKLSKYNQWENEHRSSLSKSEKLQEFLILFNLAEHIPAKEVMRQQKHHLENLVAMQARLIAVFQTLNRKTVIERG